MGEKEEEEVQSRKARHSQTVRQWYPLPPPFPPSSQESDTAAVLAKPVQSQPVTPSSHKLSSVPTLHYTHTETHACLARSAEYRPLVALTLSASTHSHRCMQMSMAMRMAGNQGKEWGDDWCTSRMCSGVMCPSDDTVKGQARDISRSWGACVIGGSLCHSFPSLQALQFRCRVSRDSRFICNIHLDWCNYSYSLGWETRTSLTNEPPWLM